MKYKIRTLMLLGHMHLLTTLVLRAGEENAKVSLSPGAQPSSADIAKFPERKRLKARLSWGHQSALARTFRLNFLATDAEISQTRAVGFEENDLLREDVAHTHSGAGDVDGLEFTITFPVRNIGEIGNLQQIWSYLFAHSDSDTRRRLRLDPGFRPDTRKLTVQMNQEGTSGFSVTIDQLLTNNAFWMPELDVFLSAGETPVSFSDHQKAIVEWKGQRVLEQLKRDPESTYEQYINRWEDMGSPLYKNPASVPPGHIVCMSWDGGIAKFGIDRGANVWNDYGNPDHFRFSFDFGGLQSLEKSWKGQKLADGLPVITTTIEKNGVRYEVEQFAYPLHGPPADRRGDIPMVMLQKVRLSELEGKAKPVGIGMTHSREFFRPGGAVVTHTNGNTFTWTESISNRLALSIQGDRIQLLSNSDAGNKWHTNKIVIGVTLPAKGAREFVIKLPSQLVAATDLKTFNSLNYESARKVTLKFWSGYLDRGARFDVPEEVVNTLFRANLWHALRLPRRHAPEGNTVKMDLPYSNFAYDQKGTPWPVNQAIYVDYMLYDLRGYPDISEEELSAMFRNNQEANGHVGGFANWGVYTPSMIYAVAKHYLLTRDRASLERLLPQTLKALDWCLLEFKRASERNGPTRGLMLAPLNDLSHDLKAWAFNQSYMFAGLDLLGKALTDINHPRASECRDAARSIYDAVQRGFGHATMRSPLVQMRDHTWMPYVPADALTPRRLLDIWYPTDVDCGALHMSRLKALDPNGPLTTFLLNDHEDNLFLNSWGMANEPVYNQHATALLCRDDVKPVIRAFYSMMACAFSHSVFEPVEHRWGWGQYFGPPSTDGAWFELYRNMLIQERDDGTLLLFQATPRKWLEDGKQIRVERAPTYYGPLNLTLRSHAAKGEIKVAVSLSPYKRPGALVVRLRHPQEQPIRSVTINGKKWTEFDPAKEWIRIPNPGESNYKIVARY